MQILKPSGGRDWKECRLRWINLPIAIFILIKRSEEESIFCLILTTIHPSHLVYIYIYSKRGKGRLGLMMIGKKTILTKCRRSCAYAIYSEIYVWSITIIERNSWIKEMKKHYYQSVYIYIYICVCVCLCVEGIHLLKNYFVFVWKLIKNDIHRPFCIQSNDSLFTAEVSDKSSA